MLKLITLTLLLVTQISKAQSIAYTEVIDFLENQNITQIKKTLSREEFDLPERINKYGMELNLSTKSTKSGVEFFGYGFMNENDQFFIQLKIVDKLRYTVYKDIWEKNHKLKYVGLAGTNVWYTTDYMRISFSDTDRLIAVYVQKK